MSGEHFLGIVRIHGDTQVVEGDDLDKVISGSQTIVKVAVKKYPNYFWGGITKIYKVVEVKGDEKKSMQ